MPKLEWKKLMSTAHSTTRICHITADLIRECIPNATATTPIRAKWTVVEKEGRKILQVELKESA